MAEAAKVVVVEDLVVGHNKESYTCISTANTLPQKMSLKDLFLQAHFYCFEAKTQASSIVWNALYVEAGKTLTKNFAKKVHGLNPYTFIYYSSTFATIFEAILWYSFPSG
ncbi:hypothetical protein ACFO3D_15670 [Virgibacillus kekensis]|uniref:Uncharacterized protein n=1 Tax=Virgibacillus kekensis TaxID=202261 RepID=A0ABV9DL95_9BACI